MPTKRQQLILDRLHRSEGGVATREMHAWLQESFEPVSRVTVIRDLDALVKRGLAQRTGMGRSVRYTAKLANPSLRHIDANTYFSADDADRSLVHGTYHPSALAAFASAFTSGERAMIAKLNGAYLRRMRALPAAIIRREAERFTAEFSWKSSQIEGNTYTLLDTEVLLKERREAQGHSHHEAQMILNHKEALDFIFAHSKEYARLKLATVERLHELVVRDLNVSRGLRSSPVGILGTAYKPLGLSFQLREALALTLRHINKEPWPPAKALLALLMIAYIQPFEDGNKRTARLLGNALLIAGGFCPLSFRSIDEKEYKKAVILFYERHNIRYFKELFLEQFAYSARNYFL